MAHSARPLSRRLLLAAVAGLPACGLPQAPPTPLPTPPPTPTMPAPTATPSLTPPPATSPGGKIEVSGLWVRRDGKEFSGGTSKVIIGVEKSPDSELRVGFFEQEVGGSGPMWRAAGWMAVIMSGLMLGVEPTEYRYSYDVGGYADGPSGGALLTVGTLAAILGHTVKADAAMTGTINPDGTVGPVGGIPHKIDGAAKAGKKLVLIPAGQRHTMDENTKTKVDVVERGKRQGVEVREAANIYEAYELLTGRPLPRPASRPATGALPAWLTERTRAKVESWLARYGKLKEQYAALAADYQSDYAKQVAGEAATFADKAAAHLKEGREGAAYQKALAATLNGSLAVTFPRVAQGYDSGGMTGVNNRLRPVRPDLKIESFLEQVGRREAATLADAVALADAYGNLGLAIGMVELGDAALRYEPRGQRASIIQRVITGTLMYVFAAQAVDLAQDSLDLGFGNGGGAPVGPPERLERLAELFRRAAEANLNYFESIVLKQLADTYGVHVDLMRGAFEAMDLSYLLANAALRSTKAMQKRTRGYIPATYAMLGSSLNSYVLSSLLVAKYATLEVKYTDEGIVTGVENEAALAAMLDFAERRAQELLGMVASVGGEAAQPLLNYASARANRTGDITDKFDALQSYWTAALQGQIIGMLSGSARPSF